MNFASRDVEHADRVRVLDGDVGAAIADRAGDVLGLEVAGVGAGEAARVVHRRHAAERRGLHGAARQRPAEREVLQPDHRDAAVGVDAPAGSPSLAASR